MIELKNGYVIDNDKGAVRLWKRTGKTKDVFGSDKEVRTNESWYSTLDQALTAYANKVIIDKLDQFHDLTEVVKEIKILREEVAGVYGFTSVKEVK